METLKKTQFFLTNMPIEKVLVLSEKLYLELVNLERLDLSDTSGKLRKLLDELLEVISIQPNGAEIMLPQADGNYYPFQPAKPVSLATLLALVEAGRKARVIRKLPREEQLARLKKNLEYARAEATARGIALEDEKDAAIYD